MQRRRTFALLAGTAAMLALALPAAHAATRNDQRHNAAGPGVRKVAAGRWHVSPHGSIQAAVDAADPGDTIFLASGIYHQSVAIQKNGITLRGAGPRLTVLVPPKDLSGLCKKYTGGSGVCVLGHFDKNFNLERRTKDVSIIGIGLNHWPASGAFGIGTADLRYQNLVALHDGEYGLASFNSKGTVMKGNVSRGAAEAGLYLGDSPRANGLIANNRVLGSTFGIFIRHDHLVQVTRNVGTRSCEGIFVFDDGSPDGVGHITVRYNVMNANNRFCPGHPPIRGGGIALVGATHSLVAWNVTRNNQGHRIISGGITLITAKKVTGGKDVMFNTVAHNTAFGNVPADIVYDGSGAGNLFVANSCGTSLGGSFC
jgi:hypothetical protein